MARIHAHPKQGKTDPVPGSLGMVGQLRQIRKTDWGALILSVREVGKVSKENHNLLKKNAIFFPATKKSQDCFRCKLGAAHRGSVEPSFLLAEVIWPQYLFFLCF